MTQYSHKTETCGICKKEVNQRQGLLYYSGDNEWGHLRLFICNDCHEDIAVQRTHHEQCYECIEPYDQEFVEIGLLEPLWDSRNNFEKAHEKIFDKLPATTEKNAAMYPGSTCRDFEKWLKENFPNSKKPVDEENSD